MLRVLPDGPGQLAKMVRGLLIHNGFVRFKKMEFPPEPHADANRMGALPFLRECSPWMRARSLRRVLKYSVKRLVEAQ